MSETTQASQLVAITMLKRDIGVLKRDIGLINVPHSPSRYLEKRTLLNFELPKDQQSIANLEDQKKKLEDFHLKMSKAVNQQERIALGQLYEKALGFLKDIEDLEASYSTFDIYDFYALNHAKNSFSWITNAHARLAYKLSLPDPSPRLNFEEFESRFNEHFRTHRSESFKTFVVSQMFIFVSQDEVLYETFARLTPKVVEFYSEMAKREVLLSLAPNKPCPRYLEPFRLGKDSDRKSTRLNSSHWE